MEVTNLHDIHTREELYRWASCFGWKPAGLAVIPDLDLENY